MFIGRIFIGQYREADRDTARFEHEIRQKATPARDVESKRSIRDVD
jgi:hypothetical protein